SFHAVQATERSHSLPVRLLQRRLRCRILSLSEEPVKRYIHAHYLQERTPSAWSRWQQSVDQTLTSAHRISSVRCSDGRVRADVPVLLYTSQPMRYHLL